MDHAAPIEEREMALLHGRAEIQDVGRCRRRLLENFPVYLFDGLSHLRHANILDLGEAIFDALGTLRFCGTA